MSVFKKLYENSVAEINKNVLFDNAITESALFDNLSNIVMSSFKWKLPEYIHFSLPERFMFESGMMAGFIDDNGEFRIYPASACGVLREDGFSSRYIMYALNGKVWQRDYEDVALCMNGFYRIPGRFIVLEFLEKISNVYQAISVALNKAKSADIFCCENEKTVDAINNVWQENKNNKPYSAIVDIGFKDTVEKYSLFDNRMYDILSMWELGDKYLHMFYTWYGINNIETQKKERLVSNEVERNNEIISHGYFSTLSTYRHNFCEEVRKKFGVDISIKENREEDKEIREDGKEENEEREVNEDGANINAD